MSTVSAKMPSILIVEDEIMIAMHMASMIRDLGYEVLGIAVDKESALKLAAGKPDIVLVDCKLRDGLTGPELGRHIAESIESAVIFVTANPQYVIERTEPHPAILGIYPKPVNDNEIGEILAFALNARRGQMTEVIPPRALRPLNYQSG